MTISFKLAPGWALTRWCETSLENQFSRGTSLGGPTSHENFFTTTTILTHSRGAFYHFRTTFSMVHWDRQPLSSWIMIYNNSPCTHVPSQTFFLILYCHSTDTMLHSLPSDTMLPRSLLTPTDTMLSSSLLTPTPCSPAAFGHSTDAMLASSPLTQTWHYALCSPSAFWYHVLINLTEPMPSLSCFKNFPSSLKHFLITFMWSDPGTIIFFSKHCLSFYLISNNDSTCIYWEVVSHVLAKSFEGMPMYFRENTTT